jgi:hypothetical protein
MATFFLILFISGLILHYNVAPSVLKTDSKANRAARRCAELCLERARQALNVTIRAAPGSAAFAAVVEYRKKVSELEKRLSGNPEIY